MLRKLFILILVLISLFMVAGEAQAATCTILTTNLRSGSSDALTGNMVSSLIRFLQESGYVPASTAISAGKMTFGSQTLAGLKQYQLSQKLAPTGVANLATRFRILLSSCNLGGVAVTPTTSWQAGASRAITWNRNAIRAAYIEIALVKTDTTARYILSSSTLNDGAETVLLPSSLPAGTYSMEAKLAFSLGGKVYALGYPTVLARSISVSAASRPRGGNPSGDNTPPSSSTSYSFDDLSAPSSLVSGNTGTLNMSGTNIDHYVVSFNCGSDGTLAYSSSGSKHYCASMRSFFRYAPLSVSGSDTSLSFLAKNENSVNKTITVTVSAYKSDNTLVGSRNTTITITPYGAPTTPSVMIISPQQSAGTNWITGSTRSIQWSFSDGGNYPVSITLRHCLNDAVPCQTSGQASYSINPSVVGLSYSWVVGNYSNGTSIGLPSGYYLMRLCRADTSTGCDATDVTISVSGAGSSGNFSPTFTSFTATNPSLTSGTEQVFSYSFTKLHHLVLSFTCASGVSPCQSLTITPGTGVTSGQVARVFTNSNPVSSTVTATLTAYNDSGNTVGTKSLTFTVSAGETLASMFSGMTAPSTMVDGETGVLSLTGTNITRYDVTFDCGASNNIYVVDPTTAIPYCSNVRTAYNLGTLSMAGSNWPISFKVSNTSQVNQMITVTGKAYTSNGSLLLARTTTITVAPPPSASPEMSQGGGQYGAVGATLQQLINLLLQRR